MNIKKFNIFLWILFTSNIYNTAYKTTPPQLVRKIAKPKTLYKPKAFNTYKSVLPLTSYKINSLLSKKAPQIQNKIQNHQFFKDLIIEVNQIPKIEIKQQPLIKFNEKTLLKLEIFMYCLEHPQEAEEIMNFYQEMKDANHLIKDRLEFLPAHAQEFFKEQVQKYLDSKEINNQDIHPIKAKILKLYPYVITALKVGFYILIFTLYFIIINVYDLDTINYENLSNSKNPQEQQLIEIFNLLTEALNLEPISLYKAKTDSAAKIRGQDTYAAYTPFIKIIEVSKSFFNLNLDTQVFVLLHELRHYQQETLITIPEDVIKYAQEYNVQPLGLNFIIFFNTGFFWSNAMIELDADLFAARQMKDYKYIKNIATDLHEQFISDEYLDKLMFNQKAGYLTSGMIYRESSQSKKPSNFDFIKNIESIDIEDIEDKLMYLNKKSDDFLHYAIQKWNKFIYDLPPENMYLRYVPQHLKEASIKNKTIKEEKKETLQEAKQLFEEYYKF